MRISVWFGYAAKNPKEVRAEIFIGFPANTARFTARHKSFYLNMNKPRSCDVAAQDVSVWCVSERHNGRVAPTTKLTSNKELARVSPATFIFFGHDSFKSLTP